MNIKLYNAFVEKNPIISRKYNSFKNSHELLHKYFRPIDWSYLLYLNIKSKKKPNLLKVLKKAESYNYEKIKEKIKYYDVISFDIFDTVIIRSLNEPADVFQLMNLDLDLIDFKRNRIEAERNARKIKWQKQNTYEVNINEIYDALLDYIPYTKEELIEKELKTELKVCKCNPIVKELYDYAKKLNKKIIFTSDMYWSKNELKQILNNCEYNAEVDDIYVSNEENADKASGKLQKLIVNKLNKTVLHIGDSISDISKKVHDKRWKAIKIPRPRDCEYFEDKDAPNTLAMSQIKALNYQMLYAPANKYNRYYKHGYMFGGSIVYGYTNFINDIVKNDKDCVVLFTARDSEIFYKRFKEINKATDAKYVYCSRESLLKAVFPYAFETYFDVLFQAKVNQKIKITIKKSLDDVELGELFNRLNFKENELLTNNNIRVLRAKLNDNKRVIASIYQNIQSSCKDYFSPLINNKNKVYIIDLGWRGASFALLKHIISSINKNATIKGIVFGADSSNIANNSIQTKALIPFCFSSNFNKQYVTAPFEKMIVETLFGTLMSSTFSYDYIEQQARPIFCKNVDGQLNIYNDFKKGILGFCSKCQLKSLESKLETFHLFSKTFNSKAYIHSIYDKTLINNLAVGNNETAKIVLKKLGY